MIDPLEIRKEIARLEYEESSYSNYAKLATLYTIRAEMQKSESKEREIEVLTQPSKTVSRASRSAESEFAKAIDGKSQDKVLEVLDELVDSLSVSQPKLYSAVISKLNRL